MGDFISIGNRAMLRSKFERNVYIILPKTHTFLNPGAPLPDIVSGGNGLVMCTETTDELVEIQRANPFFARIGDVLYNTCYLEDITDIMDVSEDLTAIRQHLGILKWFPAHELYVLTKDEIRVAIEIITKIAEERRNRDDAQKK